ASLASLIFLPAATRHLRVASSLPTTPSRSHPGVADGSHRTRHRAHCVTVPRGAALSAGAALADTGPPAPALRGPAARGPAPHAALVRLSPRRRSALVRAELSAAPPAQTQRRSLF